MKLEKIYDVLEKAIKDVEIEDLNNKEHLCLNAIKIRLCIEIEKYKNNYQTLMGILNNVQ